MVKYLHGNTEHEILPQYQMLNNTNLTNPTGQTTRQPRPNRRRNRQRQTLHESL
jgi:hypothetical protein